MILRISEFAARTAAVFLVAGMIAAIIAFALMSAAPELAARFPSWTFSMLVIALAAPNLVAQFRLVFANPNYPAPGEQRRIRRIAYVALFWFVFMLGVASSEGWFDGDPERLIESVKRDGS